MYLNNLKNIDSIATSIKGIDILRLKKANYRFSFLKPTNKISLESIVNKELYNDGTVLWFSSYSDCLIVADALRKEGYTHILLADTLCGNQEGTYEPFCLLTDCSYLNFLSLDQPIFDAYLLVDLIDRDIEYFNSELTGIVKNKDKEKLSTFFKENIEPSVNISEQDSGKLKVELSGTWEFLNETKDLIEYNFNSEVEIIVYSW